MDPREDMRSSNAHFPSTLEMASREVYPVDIENGWYARSCLSHASLPITSIGPAIFPGVAFSIVPLRAANQNRLIGLSDFMSRSIPHMDGAALCHSQSSKSSSPKGYDH